MIKSLVFKKRYPSYDAATALNTHINKDTVLCN